MPNDEMMYFDSEEAMEVAMEGNPDVVDAILTGRAAVGKAPDAPVEEVVDELPPIEETPEIVPEPIPIEDVPAIEPEDPLGDFTATLAAEKAAMTKEFEEGQEALRTQLAEANKKLEEKATPVVEEPAVSLGEEDAELATEYERNNRKLIEDIKNQGKISPELLTRLEAIESRDKVRQDRKDKEDADNTAAINREKLYTELDRFSKDKEQLKLPIGVGEARITQNEFKAQLAENYKLSDPGEIERLYRRVVKEKSAWADAQREKIVKAKIEMPEYSENYLNLTELYERQSGNKFNVRTGKYDAITDTFGNTSRLPSIEDAYKLSNYSNLISTAATTEAREIQKKLDQQMNSAAILDDSITSGVDGVSNMTEADMNAILDMDYRDIQTNPELATRYADVMKTLGRTVPRGLIK